MEQWRSRVRKTLVMRGPTVAEARSILRAELGDFTDAEFAPTISSCMVKAQRTETVRGKLTSTTYEYLSLPATCSTRSSGRRTNSTPHPPLRPRPRQEVERRMIPDCL